MPDSMNIKVLLTPLFVLLRDAVSQYTVYEMQSGTYYGIPSQVLVHQPEWDDRRYNGEEASNSPANLSAYQIFLAQTGTGARLVRAYMMRCKNVLCQFLVASVKRSPDVPCITILPFWMRGGDCLEGVCIKHVWLFVADMDLSRSSRSVPSP